MPLSYFDSLNYIIKTLLAFTGTDKEVHRGSSVRLSCSLSETDLVASFTWKSKSKQKVLGQWYCCIDWPINIYSCSARQRVHRKLIKVVDYESCYRQQFSISMSIHLKAFKRRTLHFLLYLRDTVLDSTDSQYTIKSDAAHLAGKQSSVLEVQG